MVKRLPSRETDQMRDHFVNGLPKELHCLGETGIDAVKAVYYAP